MKHFKFFDWIKNYQKGYLSGDLSAGLTVGVMLIPQGMAYAMLAGLPPIYGLYAATIPLIIYALLGSSPQLAVGPVAMVSLLIASGVGAIADIGSAQFIQYAILLALMVGVIQLAMGVFRLGFLVNFLSHPVIAGFTSAAALIIGISQMKHLLGVKIPRGDFIETLTSLIGEIGNSQPYALMIGIGAIVLLMIFKKWKPRFPAPLLVVILGIVAVQMFNLEEQGLAIVGEVPSGLPAFSIPSFDMGAIESLLPIAFAISFVGFLESIAVAKAVQKKHKDYEVIANQELVALGAANVLGSFFQSFSVTGGFSRTAVNDKAGAKSGLASIISAALVILTLLFFTSYFKNLPSAILASIIIVAVAGLVDIKEARFLWKNDRQDFVLFMITALATLFFGVEPGILTGVILSIGLMVFRVSYPHYAILGRVPGTKEYRNIERFENLEVNDDILILRFDGRMYFGNSEAFRKIVTDNIQNRPNVKNILIDASSINGLDSSAVHMLHDLNSDLKDKGIMLCFSNVKGPVRDTMTKNKILTEENYTRFFLSVYDAVSSLCGDDNPEYKKYVTQVEA
ncbi:MAG: solute carrier family 26 protein [Bacteroidia bacterium]|nr:solute carrier family 26 protein [Bacteroidia bacterium]